MWRFRKYYFKLLASAVAFSAIFICGIYITDMSGKSLSEPIEQFTIDSKMAWQTIASNVERKERHLSNLDYFFDTISEYDGVYSVEYSEKIFGADVRNMIIMSEQSAYRSSGDMATI